MAFVTRARRYIARYRLGPQTVSSEPHRTLEAAQTWLQENATDGGKYVDEDGELIDLSESWIDEVLIPYTFNNWNGLRDEDTEAGQ